MQKLMRHLLKIFASRVALSLLALSLFCAPAFSQHLETTPIRDFTPEQNQKAAEVYVQQPDLVVQHMWHLGQKLEEKKPQIYRHLAEKQISALREALMLPNETRIEQKRKFSSLAYLRYDEFKDFNWDLEEDQLKIGEKLYAYRVDRPEDYLDEEPLGLSIPGEGTIQPVQIGESIAALAIEEKSQVQFILLPSHFPEQSKDLDRYVSLLRDRATEGGGRPVVLVRKQHIDVEEATTEHPLRYRYFDVPKTTLGKIKNWWDSVYYTPNEGSYILTGFSVLLTVATTEGISAINYFFGAEHAWNQTTTLISAGYATIFGIFGKTYSEITRERVLNDPKSTRKAFIKRTLIGAATFAYTIQIMNHGIDSISLMHVGGWLENIALLGYSATSVAISDRWKEFALTRERMGLNRGSVTVLGTPVKRKFFDRIVIKSLPRAIKRFNPMYFNAHIATQELSFGWSIYYSSYIWTQYLIMKWAERNNFIGKEQLRENWEKLIDLPKRTVDSASIALNDINEDAALLLIHPKLFFKFAKHGFNDLMETIAQKCDFLMSGKQKNDNPLFIPEKTGDWLNAR